MVGVNLPLEQAKFMSFPFLKTLEFTTPFSQLNNENVCVKISKIHFNSLTIFVSLKPLRHA